MAFGKRSENTPVPASVNTPKAATARPNVAVGMRNTDTVAASVKAREDLRNLVFKDLLDAMNLTELASMESTKAKLEVGEVVRALISQQNTTLSMDDQETVAMEVVNDVLGLGPLEQLLTRDDIADIMVCGPDKVYIEVAGRLELTDIKFRDEAQLINICRKIVSAVGRRVDESSPICDARLADGSRVAIVAPPLSVDGTSLTIRKFKKEKLGLVDLIKFGSVSKSGSRILEIASQCRCNILVSGGTGSGKALSVNAKLLSPTGWRKMGDIRVGDPLLAPDGKLTRVTGVYPQGQLEMFSVLFEDGRSVECCDSHLWKVWTRTSTWCPIRKKKVRGMGWKVVPLSNIRKWFDNDRSQVSRTAIPLVESFAIEQPEKQLEINPYAIGVLLGDGNLTNNTPRLSSMDQGIMDEFQSSMPDHTLKSISGSECDYRVIMKNRLKVSPLRLKLKKLGLHGLKSHEKFVPQEYKTGSVSQRLELLRGLLDTDGWAQDCGASFSSTSEQLAKDVQEIAWSLGAIAKISSKETFYTYLGKKRAGKRSYVVHIRMPDAKQLFSLERKSSSVSSRQTALRLRIKSIKPVGVQEAQCISVDHPDKLYITDNWIVTHNTTLLNCLTRFIDPGEAIITCEDACELQLQQGNVRRWETRPPNLEGAGEITMSMLVKAALRHRPERIIIGEVRGKEAFDLLQAMNTGHDGSAGTVHSNSPREAIGRVESMIAMGGFTLSAKTVREQITSSIDLIVQASRLRDGSRKITHITEVVGLEGETVTLQDLVLFEITGEDANGKIIGRHRSTGMRPHFLEKARAYGLDKELMLAMQEVT